ncbi:MAG: hypothetical protein JXA25_10350 [Anaerolineales bacterium]|nr:hypothetical protein [Anaerolineales bacterium]
MKDSKKNIFAGLRFHPFGKVYHYDASHLDEVRVGDFVFVSTGKGQEIAEVVQLSEEPPEDVDANDCKQVDRKATARELVVRLSWQRKEQEAEDQCRILVKEQGLEGVKISRAQFSFNGTRLTFFYNSEGDERIDLKKILPPLRKRYRSSKVEFRQIGPRDVAQSLTGMGACGMEERCCSRYMTSFNPISIKMAKVQGISLNPQEITGMCGRLRCCLLYEYELYREASRGMPKKNKKVNTPLGEGKVIELLPLKGTVIVALAEGQRAEFSREEVESAGGQKPGVKASDRSQKQDE